jgi:hypothetical protein
MPARLVLVAALAIACHGALAQTPTVPPSVTVQRLAPQLVAFAGSEANFQALVAGLTGGTQVQLFSVLPSGFTQSVTFTPTAALSPAQAAQVLEAARQQLIGLGIGAPTSEQLAFALMGGTVPTALGGTLVPGQLNTQAAANPPSPAAQIQAQNAGAGATTVPTATTPGITNPTPGVTNRVNVQTTPGTAVTSNTTVAAPRVNTSDSLVPPGATSRSPLPLTSASPAFGTSTSPVVPIAPQAPGAGSSPPTAERVAPGPRPALH